MNTLKKKFRQIKKFPDWIFLFPALFLKTLKVLMRTELSDPFDHIHSEAPIVTVTWHNRLLFFPVMFPRWIRKKTIAIVSASRDGQYVTDLIRYFGLKSLRGSSSRRGAPVFREAVKALKQGYHVSFTPDGPRGPKYRMSRGPVRLASMTGSRIIPISVNYSSYWQLKSWDNFQIPKPWAKIILVLGPAVEVPPEIDDKEIEEYRKIVENALMKITLD